ncbi:MAG TPA: hypothetical protein VEC36_02290, partial [Patescibacteria group bacterium]|nr:hypothetical protein [Patescibacteria group bacterium]
MGFVEDGTDELIIDAGNDTTICFGQKIEIQAKSNSTSVRYRWFPLEGLSNPNTENPLAAPSVTTTYFVTVT